MLKGPWTNIRRCNWRLYAIVYVGFTLLFYVVSIVVNPVINKGHGWLYSLDFFAELRDAHLITWGGYQLLYSSGTSLVVPPLGPLTLTPLALISSAFGFVEPFPMPLPRPSVLLISIPYLAIFATFFFFAVRQFVSRFGLGGGRIVEVSSTLIVSFALMPWGHIEDVAAIAFVVLGFVKLSEGKALNASYLFGVAIAFQPFALLFVIPALLILVRGRRDCVISFSRAAIPSIAVYLPLMVTSPLTTINTLLHQNNFPSVDHLTIVGLVIDGGAKSIAAGPPRLALILVVIAVSLLMRYSRRYSIHSYSEVFLVIALLSAGRIFFEPVMVPYYVIPTLVYLMLSGVFFKTHLVVRTAALFVASCIVVYFASLRMGAVAYSIYVYCGSLVVTSVVSIWYISFSSASDILRQAIAPYRYGDGEVFDEIVQTRGDRSRFGVVPNEARIDLDDVAPGGSAGGNES